MSAQAFEGFLAKLYCDEAALARFRTDPRREAQRAGLTLEESAALEQIDWTGLELAAKSFARKRARKKRSTLWQKVAQKLCR